MQVKTIGIIGAGKLGVVLAQLALKAGYQVYISGSGAVSKIKLIVETLAPEATPATTQEVVAKSDVIILAIPLRNFRQLPKEVLVNKLVIDATNYWWEVDGPREDILKKGQSSSEAVQEFLQEAKVVKAFNHMGYHDLHDEPRASGAEGRKAIAIAGDGEKEVATVVALVDSFGFDPLPIGSLQEGWRLEAGQPAFGANVSKEELGELVFKANKSV